MRLIDSNELVRKANKLEVFYFTGETDIQIHDCQMVELGAVLTEIDEAPTVDAVPVVRCKDCKHFNHVEETCLDQYDICGMCRDVKPDDFCSFGERIEK